MKLPFVLIIITTSVTALFAQNPNSKGRTFEYSQLGINDFVVTDIDSIQKEDLYNKTVRWVKETYRNPESVLTMKIENEKIRIDAIATGLLKVRGRISNLNYIVEISFKDNKYKFEIISLLYNNTTDYKKIPNFKTDSKMVKNFGSTPTDIETYFNKLNESLRIYIAGERKRNDDW